ncbi:MAG: DNA polymerase III subunit beta [Patescibacteria group bacterium]
MKIECVKENIGPVISKVERISGKNLNLQILNNICIEVKDKIVKIKSTNLDLGIEIIIPAKIHSEGIVVVPGKVLSVFLENLKSDSIIILEKKENTLLISTKHNSSILKTYSDSEFPTIPFIQNKNINKISSKEFVNGLKSVWFGASQLNIKPELSSIFIYPESSSMVFVTTDSFRLAEKKVKIKKGEGLDPILIPIKNIPEIIKVLDDVLGDVDVLVDKNQISFTKDGIYLTSRLIDGIFPDYKQIIPKESITEIVVLKEDFINALKVSQIFSDNFNQVNFTVNPKQKKFELKTKNSDVGESTQLIDGIVKGEESNLSFNYKYITDCFQSIVGDSIVLKLSGMGKPMVIQSVSDNTFTYIVMPMNK